MLNTILSILLAVTLFLGTGVATVAASQGSQPDDLLYEVKLASESAFMNLTSDPAAQFDLSLDYVETRAEEIILMMLEGEQPSTQVLTRYQAQVEKAMAIAVGLDDQNAIDALEQLQIRLESQNRVFTELQKNASPDSENALTQIHTMLEERVRQIDTGQTNLLQLRQQIQVQEQLNNPDQGQHGQSAENGPQSTTSSGDGNPWTEGTPTPNSGFGPGPGECDTTCTPQGDGEGNNPQSFGTPVPNTNYGYSYWWWLTKTPVGQNGKH